MQVRSASFFGGAGAGRMATMPPRGPLPSLLGLIALLLGNACAAGGTSPAGWTTAARTTTAAPRPDPALQRLVDDTVAGFDGTVGVYVRHLGTGAEAQVRADELFPTASMIKVPILIGLLARVEAGELDYRQKLTYRAERLYPGEDLLGSFQDGATVTLDQVAMLSITTSDNTAALWCQELAGTGTAINAHLERLGLRHTRVNSRTPGREADRERLGWGQTTPREMAGLFVQIRAGAVISPAVSDELLRCLARIHWDGEALSALPPWVQTASKQGAVSRSRSEVVLVRAPGGDYVFCAITRDQADTGWDRENAGYRLLRALSARLWAHFEPGSDWRPPSGHDRF